MTTTQLDPKQPDFELIPKSPADVAKAIAYSIGAILGALFVATQTDNQVTRAEVLPLVIVFLGLVGVWWVRGTIAKTVLTVATAGVQALALYITDASGFADVTINQWILVLLTAGTSIGVAIIPNGGVGAQQKQRDGRHELGSRDIHLTDLSSSVSHPPAGGSGVSRTESKVTRVELSPEDREFLAQMGKGGYTGRTGSTGFTIPD